MANFIYKLQNIINTSPDYDDTDINIARCLLKKLRNITPKTNLQEVADFCYISKSSISRFCKKLGYTNFNEFKYDCIDTEEELHETVIDYHGLEKMDFQLFMNHILNSFISVDTNILDKHIDILCDYIYRKERIFIFATHIPGDLANILQRAVIMTGKMIEFYPRKEHQIEIAKQLCADDLCIFFSLEGNLLMDKSITIPAIMSQSDKVLITQNMHSKFVEDFSLVVGLGEYHDEIIGKYKLLFFIDCLINRYYYKYVVDSLHKN